jgi:hypothetical protein
MCDIGTHPTGTLQLPPPAIRVAWVRGTRPRTTRGLFGTGTASAISPPHEQPMRPPPLTRPPPSPRGRGRRIAGDMAGRGPLPERRRRRCADRRWRGRRRATRRRRAPRAVEPRRVAAGGSRRGGAGGDVGGGRAGGAAAVRRGAGAGVAGGGASPLRSLRPPPLFCFTRDALRGRSSILQTSPPQLYPLFLSVCRLLACPPVSHSL